MIKFSNTLVLLPLVAAECAAAQSAPQSEGGVSHRSPNLVIIMADQFRGQALGHLGLEPVRTPNLDRLAADGVSFAQTVSVAPVSSPARAIMMSGMYPLSNNVVWNCNSKTTPLGCELGSEVRCWSDVLADMGYSLGYIGKWHLDSPHEPYVDCSNNRGEVKWNEWCPPSRRHSFDYWLSYGTYDQHLRPMYWSTDATRDQFNYVDRWGPEFEADRAVDYILNTARQRVSDKPFALVVSMNPPHTGYSLVPDCYKQLYKNIDLDSLCAAKPSIPAAGTRWGDYYRSNILDYYAAITGVDRQAGRIVDALKQSGLYDNTIVIFTSDHGDCLGTHEQVSKNNCYEESVRVPFIITCPSLIERRGIDRSLLLSCADLYPTILTLMGFESAIPATVTTNNMAKAILTGRGNTEGQLFLQYADVIDKVGSAPAAGSDGGAVGYRGVRDQRYTYVLALRNGAIVDTLLFDRCTDPWQMHNIAGHKPRVERTMRRKLEKLLSAAGDNTLQSLQNR